MSTYNKLWHTRPVCDGHVYPSLEEMAKAYFAFEYNIEDDDELEATVQTYMGAMSARMQPQMLHGVYAKGGGWHEVWFEGNYICVYNDSSLAGDVMKRLEDIQ